MNTTGCHGFFKINTQNIKFDSPTLSQVKSHNFIYISKIPKFYFLTVLLYTKSDFMYVDGIHLYENLTI